MPQQPQTTTFHATLLMDFQKWGKEVKPRESRLMCQKLCKGQIYARKVSSCKTENS